MKENIKKYLEWKGAFDAGYFAYYDKEEGVNKPFKMAEFAVKDLEYTVRGFDEGTNSVIYSNDIKSFNDEEFIVKSGGGTLFTGRYKKESILALNAKLHIKITADHQGEEVIIYLKGNNYFNFSKLIGRDGEVDVATTMVKITGASDEKAGAVKYKAPIFEKGWERREEITAEITAENTPF